MKIHYKLFGDNAFRVLTPTHVKNLRKLAAHLNKLRRDYKHFDMRDYMVQNLDQENEERIKTASEANPRLYRHCGTVACAAGHGPDAGIKGKKGEDWSEYQKRVFGLGYSQAFDWAFGAEWAERDNTPRGAAQRITYMLNTGIVPNDTHEQVHGIAQLVYTQVRVPKLTTLGLE